MKISLFTLALITLQLMTANLKAEESVSQNSTSKKKEKVNYQFVFHLRNFPLKIKIFDITDKRKLKVGSTAVIKSLKDLPAKREWPNQTVTSFAGEEKKFLFVIENQTDKDFYFYATPHRWDPEEEAIGTTLYCLCYNTLFRIPSGMVWYRVGLLSTQPISGEGKSTIVHRIVGVDKSRALQMQLQN